MAGQSGSAAAKRAKNVAMAAELKRIGDERRSGMCPICYKSTGNDTFGGSSVLNHISAHARGAVESYFKE